MAKLLFVILVNFVVSTSVSFGENICSHYDDKDCVHPDTTKNDYYANQWSVYMPGITKDEAKQLLEDNGFDYLGQIIDGLEIYLVTRKGTPEKHAMPDEKTIELLKKHKQVHSVAQKHVLENSADKVFSIVDNNNVECMSLDPSSIKLNDGSENLKRAQEREDGEAVATMYNATRPASSSGSVDLYDQINNNNTINSAGAAVMPAEKFNMQRDDIAAALMAAVAAAASNAAVATVASDAAMAAAASDATVAAVASDAAEALATAIVDSLPPSETNEWTVAGNGGPYYGDVSDDALALEEYLLNEYLIQNMKNQTENVSKIRSLRDVNQRLSEDPVKANLLNGGQLFDNKLSVDGTTVTGLMDNENRRPEF